MASIDFKPHPKQFEALQYLQDKETSEVLFGGGARGGKSYFGCAWIIMEALSKPGSTWLIGRNELKRLKQTTLITFHEVLKDFGLAGNKNIKFDEQNGMIRFVDRDVIVFLIDLSHQPSDPNYDRLGSFGLTGAFIDEAQEIHEKAINVLKGRFSNLSGEKIVGGGQKRYWKTIPKVLYTCNPAKNWIYQDFYKLYKQESLPKSKKFVPSLVTDNPHIEPEYIEQLKTADKITKERLLYGNFDYDDTPGRLFDYDAIADMWSNPKKTGKRYITCDAARLGADKTVIMVWNDYVMEECSELSKSTTLETAEEVRRLAGRYTIPMSQVLVDEDGVGGGVVDELRCRGFVNNSTAISPLSAKYRKDYKRNYQNLKTQCYFTLSDMVNEHKINIIPDYFREPLTEELDIVVQEDMDKDGPLRIIKKADIKERLGRSPDYADCMMMRAWFELNRVPEEGETVENSIDTELYKLLENDIFSKRVSKNVVHNEIPDTIY